MDTTHPNFPQPENENILVWRYLTLQKYLNLLTSRQLYLCRSDLFEDPLEGSLTSINSAFLYGMRGFQAPDDLIVLAQDKIFHERSRYLAYVNCWTKEEKESLLLWKLYCGKRSGVAVQSTYKKLSNCIDNEKHIFIGEIRYIDYMTQAIPKQYHQWGEKFNLYSHKDHQHSFEKEIRIFKYTFENSGLIFHSNFDKEILTIPKFIRIDIKNLEELVEYVYIHPNTPAYLYDTICAITEKFLPKVKVKESNLKRAPLF